MSKKNEEGVLLEQTSTAGVGGRKVSETLDPALAPFALRKGTAQYQQQKALPYKKRLVCRVPAKSRCVYLLLWLFAQALSGFQGCLGCLAPAACKGMVREMERHTLSPTPRSMLLLVSSSVLVPLVKAEEDSPASAECYLRLCRVVLV